MNRAIALWTCRGIVCYASLCALRSYPEDDNIATLIGLPADDLSTLQKEDIWYQALPVLLYLVAYSFAGLFGHVIQLYFAIVGRIAGPIYRWLVIIIN